MPQCLYEAVVRMTSYQLVSTKSEECITCDMHVCALKRDSCMSEKS